MIDEVNKIKEVVHGLQTDLKIHGQRIAVTTDSEHALIGRIVWYTITEMIVPIDDLRTLFERYNIPKEYFPNEPRPIDCFKNAVTKYAHKHTEYLFTDEVIVENGIHKRNSHTKYLVNREKDPNSNALPIIAMWTFDQETETIVSHLIDESKLEIFMQIDNDIRTLYDTLRTHFFEKDIRDMVRQVLYKTYAISMRDKGTIYFVPIEYNDIIVNLSKLVNELNRYIIKTKSECVTIPVIRTDELRDLVIVKYEEEVLSEIEKMIKEVTEILQDPTSKIYASQYKQYADKLNHYKKLKAKYDEQLNYQSKKVETQFEVLTKQLETLIFSDKVKPEK